MRKTGRMANYMGIQQIMQTIKQIRQKINEAKRRSDGDGNLILPILRQLVKMQKGCLRQEFGMDLEFSELASEFSDYVNSFYLQDPASISIQNITKYLKKIDANYINNSVESTVMHQQINRYQQVLKNVPDNKCINCCQTFIKDFPVSLHYNYDRSIPFITLPEQLIVKQQIAKILSALANHQRGLILIAGQFSFKFERITIQRGLQMENHIKSEQKVKRAIEEAINLIKQTKIEYKLMAVPLQKHINESILNMSEKSSQFVIKIIVFCKPDFKDLDRVCYVDNKINHLKSLFDAYVIVQNQIARQYQVIKINGENLYELIEKKFKLNNIKAGVCQCFEVFQITRQKIKKKLPKLQQISLKKTFSLPNNETQNLMCLCQIFQQNDFEKQIPYFDPKQTCALIQLINHAQLSKKIVKIENIFKDSKVSFRKYVPFLSFQQHLIKQELKQSPNLVPQILIIFFYEGKPNELETRMKQTFPQNEINFTLNFITPKVALRLMMKKYELDRLNNLIFKKYALVPKPSHVEIKNPSGNIPTFNNVSLNFKGFLKEDKGAVIFTYLLLYFAKKRPKSDISTVWQ